jgi:hypothetical protein
MLGLEKLKLFCFLQCYGSPVPDNFDDDADPDPTSGTDEFVQATYVSGLWQTSSI